jgi:hypothetical protein
VYCIVVILSKQELTLCFCYGKIGCPSALARNVTFFRVPVDPDGACATHKAALGARRKAGGLVSHTVFLVTTIQTQHALECSTMYIVLYI